MIGIGVDFRRYSDHRYRDRNNYLEWTLPIGDGTFYGKFEETDRYGKNDRKISVELYPPGRGGYWGYLALSYSPRASFYSDYSIAGYLYKEWGADQWGIGYHYSHYPLQDSHLVQLDYTHYLSDYMTLRGVYYYDIQSRSYAMLGEWRYHTPCHLDLKATYVYSSSNELLPDSRLLDDRGHNVELYVEYPFQKAFSLGGKLLWQKSLGYSRYTAEGVSFFLRKYW
jgi:YaiO family outer membrane protein